VKYSYYLLFSGCIPCDSATYKRRTKGHLFGIYITYEKKEKNIWHIYEKNTQIYLPRKVNLRIRLRRPINPNGFSGEQKCDNYCNNNYFSLR
jgi:hypothetical protein